MRGDGGDSPEGEYERYRAPVLGMLAKRFPRLDADERLSIYHDAWARVLAKRQRGERFVSLRAYLLATAGAEALHALSRGTVPTPLGPDDPRLAGLVDVAPPPDEQVVTRDEARIARSLLDTLDERQRNVLKLRWDLQLTASEIRAALGLSERQYRRLAEEGATALAERVEERQSGEWSRRTRSLLVACLVEVTRDGERRVGIASRRQREEAQRLLETDPHVAALYAEVRRTVRGAAVLLPLPVIGGDRGVSSLLPQTGELLAVVRNHFADLVQGAKQQATSLYVRISDPTLLASGPRPGPAALALAGVLAVGGGTYGAHKAASAPSPPAKPAASTPVVHPAPSTTPRAGHHTRAPVSTTRPRRPEPPPPAPAPTPPVPVQPVRPTPTPPQPVPTPPQPSQPTEFGFED